VCNALNTYLQHIKHNMSLIDRFLAVLTPYECLGCTAEGDLLCNGCIQQLTPAPDRTHSFRLQGMKAAAAYEGLAKELVAKLKFNGAQTAAREMAVLLRPFVPKEESIIIPVPTATGRVRGRGYDQAKLLARALSRETRLPYLDCLVRQGQTHQVGSSREQRLLQLQHSFRLKRAGLVRSKRILLIDDVVTTGSTMEAAAAIMHEAGAIRIEALAFCAR
jgi:ComF family protein